MPSRLWCEFCEYIAELEKLLIKYRYRDTQACVVVGGIISGMVWMYQLPATSMSQISSSFLFCVDGWAKYTSKLARVTNPCVSYWLGSSIGFTVSSRFTWGMRGGYFPVVVRAFVAIWFFGIQAYWGGQAVRVVSNIVHPQETIIRYRT